MSGQVRVKLRSGEQEIEVEGTRADVDALLALWWKSAVTADPHENDCQHRDSRRSSTKQPGRRVKATPKTEAEDGSGFDALEIANRMKQHESFPLFQEKVLHQQGDYWRKIELVLWFCDQALAPGEIRGILLCLHVKAHPPRLSEALERHGGELLHDGVGQRGAVVRRRLTDATRVAFEKWLFAVNEASTPNAA